MNYQLKEVAPEVFILLCESRQCNCPFRTSFPTEQPQMLSGKPPQVAFVNQNCGSQCPLFDMKGENVTLHCGGKRAINGCTLIPITQKE